MSWGVWAGVKLQLLILLASMEAAPHSTKSTMEHHFDLSDLRGTLQAVTTVAKRYRELTGKPLGVTGEVGELLAAQLLGLELADARQAGYDALGPDKRRIQIKARCLQDHRKPGQRIGSINIQHEWDAVVLLLLNPDYEPVAAFEASRESVVEALLRPGSKARNERGALSVSKFRSIGRQVWPPPEPAGVRFP